MSVVDKDEANLAVRGGAHLIDAEDPISALGAVSPGNLIDIRRATPVLRPVTTNIGEEQSNVAKSQQALLGVALAGADIIKVGLAHQDDRSARVLLTALRETLHEWFPAKLLVPAVFADQEVSECPPALAVVSVASELGLAGVLIDTMHKKRGRGLLDAAAPSDLQTFIDACRQAGIESWLAGSLDAEGLRRVWALGTDVACVRGAACSSTVTERGARVKSELVRALVDTIPV